MPDLRTNQKISERFDLEFVRRTRRTIRSRRIWVIVAVTISLTMIGFSALVGDQSIYQSRPVSTAHQFCRNRCEACHVVPFQSIRLDLSDHQFAREIESRSCGQCHDQNSLDHHNTVVSNQIHSCFDCHTEHRKTDDLARVSNDYCVSCHGALEREHGESIYSQRITSFDDHPEFPLVKLSSETPQAEMYSNEFVKSVEVDGDWMWKDNTKLRFNHGKHLHPSGLTVPKDANNVGNGPQRRMLTCADCHTPDDSGRYMKPIRYESHCKSCHQLLISNELNPPFSELGLPEPLPHAPVKIIRDQLRDRLMRYAQRNPNRITGARKDDDGAEGSVPEVRHPNKQKSTSSTDSRDKWSWVESKMRKIEKLPQKHPGSLIRHRCARCHVIHDKVIDDEDASAQPFSWSIEKPEIPTRWFPHSRFDHSAHTMVRCADCHYRTVKESGDAHGGATTIESIMRSESTSDILMPTIATCRSCHGSKAKVEGGGQARSDCVECHQYHHTRPESSNAFKRRGLEAFLKKK